MGVQIGSSCCRDNVIRRAGGLAGLVASRDVLYGVWFGEGREGKMGRESGEGEMREMRKSKDSTCGERKGDNRS